jgi:hypothetical protein
LPLAVDRARNVVYGFDDKNGMNALFSIALDGTNRRELVLARPDVDIDSLIRIGRDHRVVGASFATERRTTEYFDTELAKLSVALGKALPGSRASRSSMPVPARASCCWLPRATSTPACSTCSTRRPGGWRKSCRCART